MVPISRFTMLYSAVGQRKFYYPELTLPMRGAPKTLFFAALMPDLWCDVKLEVAGSTLCSSFSASVLMYH